MQVRIAARMGPVVGGWFLFSGSTSLRLKCESESGCKTLDYYVMFLGQLGLYRKTGDSSRQATPR